MILPGMETPTTDELAEKDSFAVLPGTPESTPCGNTDFHQPQLKLHRERRLYIAGLDTLSRGINNGQMQMNL
jgi:hypothetical protein